MLYVNKKSISATIIYKLVPDVIKAKFKFGQHLDEERFNMIIEHLESRGKKTDKTTVKLMKEFKD